MLLVGLTGGIGAGKSTVARLLEVHGAVVVDADELARRALEPGTPGHEAVVAAFGPSSLTTSGEIDRDWLAERVFGHADARRRLEGIVHPEVARLFAEAVQAHRATDHVVVYVVPLLVEAGLEDAFDVVVAVWAPADVRLGRLTSERGLSEEEVLARMAAQASDEDRTRVADVVLSNAGSPDDLSAQVARLWADLRNRAAGNRHSSDAKE
ncbi:MAG: dephospho-CoA kinase [Actinobacteria bacterium]|nr:dephospho-CoA kinase [Actinomycetota bacterium]